MSGDAGAPAAATAVGSVGSVGSTGSARSAAGPATAGASLAGEPDGRVVPVARYAALGLAGATAVVLAANPATRWYASQRRHEDPDYPATIPLLFDVNTEATVPTWYSAGLLLAVAAVAGLVAAVSRAAAARGAWRWLLLGAVFVAMSLDESVALHERLGDLVSDTLDVDDQGPLRNPWIVAGIVPGLALGFLTARAVATLPGRTRRWVVVGLATYLGGALGLEGLSGVVLDAHGNGFWYAAVTGAEEGAEMAGAVVLCYALLAAVEVRVREGSVRLALADRAGAPPAPAPTAPS